MIEMNVILKMNIVKHYLQLLINLIKKIEPMKNQVSERHLDKIEEYVYKTMCKKELDIVQVFERLSVYANLKTIQKYAKDNKISYNGAKNNREIITLFGVKLIADNE